MLLYTHPVMLRHGAPPGHPEHAGRLQAVLDALAPMNLPTRAAPEADRADLARVHPEAFLAALDAAAPAPGEGMVAIDADTFMTEASLEAARRAAGAVCAAVDAVLAGEDTKAFCAVRPPGHHAEPAQAMGFCLYNSIAVGAMRALEAHGLPRVAVLDFDVHHGNGTQTLAERESRLAFASTHQSPLYPGTGRAEETGPAGNVLNVPLPPGADGPRWRRAMEAQVLPALEAAKPALLLVSAGFDAHRADPLAAMALDEDDYAWAGEQVRRLADRVCEGRVVSALEGGYDLPALGASAARYVAALAG